MSPRNKFGKNKLFRLHRVKEVKNVRDIMRAWVRMAITCLPVDWFLLADVEDFLLGLRNCIAGVKCNSSLYDGIFR